MKTFNKHVCVCFSSHPKASIVISHFFLMYEARGCGLSYARNCYMESQKGVPHWLHIDGFWVRHILQQLVLCLLYTHSTYDTSTYPHASCREVSYLVWKTQMTRHCGRPHIIASKGFCLDISAPVWGSWKLRRAHQPTLCCLLAMPQGCTCHSHQW